MYTYIYSFVIFMYLGIQSFLKFIFVCLWETKSSLSDCYQLTVHILQQGQKRLLSYHLTFLVVKMDDSVILETNFRHAVQ